MVDAAAGSEGQTMRHFATVVEAADGAVHLAESLLAAAVLEHAAVKEAHDHATLVERWRAAITRCDSVRSSVEALSARHQAEGAPSDAGATALGVAEAAAASAVALADKAPYDDDGSTVTPELAGTAHKNNHNNNTYYYY